MAFIITDKNNMITSIITIGGSPEADPDQNVYEIYPGDIPQTAISDLSSYSYDGKRFTKIPSKDIKQFHIEEYKTAKIETMRTLCNFNITAGIDVDDEHYSLTTEDQLNITRLGLQAMDERDSSILVYHADGKPARIYSKQEMEYIYHKAVMWINYHITYFNLLKQYIGTMTNVMDVLAVNYLMELPKEYVDQLNEYVDISEYDFQFIEFTDTMTYEGIIPKIDATLCIDEWKKEMKRKEEQIKSEIFDNTAI